MFLKISFEDFSFYGSKLKIGLTSTWEVVRVFPVPFLEFLTNLPVFVLQWVRLFRPLILLMNILVISNGICF